MSQFIVQNALLIIIAVIAAVSLAMPLINTRRFGPMVSSEQAVSLINKQNALVVDVRAQKDFKRVRIANSVNIPANEIQNRLSSSQRTVRLLSSTTRGICLQQHQSFCAAWALLRFTCLTAVSLAGCATSCPLNPEDSSPYIKILVCAAHWY